MAAVWAGSARAAEPPHAVESGPLRAEVTADPFALTLKDASDGDLLRTRRGTLPAPQSPQARYGPLGFAFDLREPVVNNAYLGYYKAAEAETVWHHATRVAAARREGARLVFDLDTNDPLGHRLTLTIAPAAEGVLSLQAEVTGPLAAEASLTGAAFEAAEGERFIGFGERSNAADQTGNLVFNWAEEGPFSSGEGEDLMRPLVPDFTFPTGPTATNFPIPWALSTRGLGVLIDQTERSTFRMASDLPDAWHAETETFRLRLSVFAGPTPAQALRRYSLAAGRQPVPEPWIFGPWFQPTLEKTPHEIARGFRARDVPATVVQTYRHYLPCGAHVGHREEEQERTRTLHALGYKVTTYFNPHICTTYQPVYDEAARRGLLVKNRAGEPYVLSNPFTADEQVSEVDFTHPEAQAFYGGLLDEAIADGFDGWMEDFGEYTPTDSRFHDGRGGLEMHNLYPVLYHRASTLHARSRYLAVYVRSGFHGVQRFARIVWGGDPTEDWSCSDGLCAALHQALSTGASGIAYWGSDIGGFHAIVNARTDHELNIRWLQLGAVSGVMRTQANGFSFRDNRATRSQVWHPEVLPAWRRYAKLRTQLLPYIEAASAQYQRTGMPIVRHLALQFPGDAGAVARQDELMFGPDLLAAPVVEQGARERRLYLPRGQWVELNRSTRWNERQGSLGLRLPRVHAGGRELSVKAPLEELPLFVRAGSVLPLLPHQTDTLAGQGGTPALTDLREARGRLHLLAWPRGSRRARLARGESLVSRETRGGWRLELRQRRARRIRLQASLATLRRPFSPCRVTVAGRPVRFRWYPEWRLLRTNFRARRGSVRVQPC